MKIVVKNSTGSNKRMKNKNILELIRDYSKIVGSKVKPQKSIVSLNTSNEQLKFEIKTYHWH